MAIAWWIEYLDRTGNLLKRTCIYDKSDAIVTFIRDETRLDSNCRHLLPPGTSQIDLIHGTQRVKSSSLAFWPPYAA